MVIIANPTGDEFSKVKSMVGQSVGQEAGPSARWIMIRCDRETMGEALLDRLRSRQIVPDRLTVIRLEAESARRGWGFGAAPRVEAGRTPAGAPRPSRFWMAIGGGLGLLTGLAGAIPTHTTVERSVLVLLLALVGIVGGAGIDRALQLWRKSSPAGSAPSQPHGSATGGRKTGVRLIIALRMAESDWSRIGELEQIVRETGARRLQ